MNLIERAQKFSHEAHDSIRQKRKYTGEPYWVHTDEVAALSALALRRIVPALTLEQIEAGVAAAYLHDTLEDVYFVKREAFSGPTVDKVHTPSIIEKLFGFEVNCIVVELTDEYVKENYPTWNREKRKDFERRRLGQSSVIAKTIKLCDLISNTKSIVAHDPDFARVYLREKEALLPYLKDGESVVWEQANALCVDGLMQLALDKRARNA